MKYSNGFSLIRTAKVINRNRRSLIKDIIFVMQLLSQLTVLLVTALVKSLVCIYTLLTKFKGKKFHKDTVVKTSNIIELKPYLEKKQKKVV